MKLNFYIAKDYENQGCLRTPGKQTQFIPTEGGSNPILSAEASVKADSKGAPMLLCGALLRTGYDVLFGG